MTHGGPWWCKRDADFQLVGEDGPWGITSPLATLRGCGKDPYAHIYTPSICWRVQRNTGNAFEAAVRNPGGNSCHWGYALDEGTTLC